jgi:hypothetical protein
MYAILTTIAAMLAIGMTLPLIDGGWLFIAGLIWGSAMLGGIIAAVAIKGLD